MSEPNALEIEMEIVRMEREYSARPATLVDDCVIFEDGAARTLTKDELERHARGELNRVPRGGARHFAEETDVCIGHPGCYFGLGLMTHSPKCGRANS